MSGDLGLILSAFRNFPIDRFGGSMGYICCYSFALIYTFAVFTNTECNWGSFDEAPDLLFHPVFLMKLKHSLDCPTAK